MLVTQAVIADNTFMRYRVAAAAAQEGCTDTGIDPDRWSLDWRRVWAGTEGWDTRWEEAASADPPPTQDIGMDPEVITDQMIIDQVVAMKPFIMIEHNVPYLNPTMNATREFVQDHVNQLSRVIERVNERVNDLVGGGVDPG